MSTLVALMRAPWLRQYLKFGGVGLSATAIHVMIFALLIETFSYRPLMANFAAFSLAFCVSFVGHLRWTFVSDGEASRRIAQALPRFFVSALLGLLLNSMLVVLVDDVFDAPYAYAIAGMVLVVPPVLFLVNRYWVFRAK